MVLITYHTVTYGCALLHGVTPRPKGARPRQRALVIYTTSPGQEAYMLNYYRVRACNIAAYAHIKSILSRILELY